MDYEHLVWATTAKKREHGARLKLAASAAALLQSMAIDVSEDGAAGLPRWCLQ